MAHGLTTHGASDNKNLGERTYGEQLWLWRRQKRYTQAEAAKTLGVSEYAYNRSETDRDEAMWASRIVIKPSPGDLCALARRRHGLCLRTTAADLGLTPPTLLKRERLSKPSLIAAWQRLGYYGF